MTFSSSKLVFQLWGGILLILAVSVLGQSQESASGTMRDVEGNTYRTILIGSQWWTAENLNVSHYANGDSIPQVQDGEQWASLTTGAWCYYDNDPANGERYGKLYNWYAVNDPRRLAPEGWHVPAEGEWMELETTLGMNAAVADTQGWFGTTQGLQLKSATGWDKDGGGTDSVGFTALPSGIRSYDRGAFYLVGTSTSFWSSSDYGWDLVWYRALFADRSQIRRKLGTKERGFAVRLVKDAGR